MSIVDVAGHDAKPITYRQAIQAGILGETVSDIQVGFIRLRLIGTGGRDEVAGVGEDTLDLLIEQKGGCGYLEGASSRMFLDHAADHLGGIQRIG